MFSNGRTVTEMICRIVLQLLKSLWQNWGNCILGVKILRFKFFSRYYLCCPNYIMFGGQLSWPGISKVSTYSVYSKCNGQRPDFCVFLLGLPSLPSINFIFLPNVFTSPKCLLTFTWVSKSVYCVEVAVFHGLLPVNHIR